MVRRRNQLGGRHAGGSSRRVDRIGQNVTPSQAPGNAVCRSADRLADVGRPGCVNLPRRLAVLPLQGGRIAARILRVRGSVFRIAKRPGTRRVSEWLAATLEMWCRATGCEFESRALRSLPEPSSQAARGLELAISALLRFPASAEPVCQRLGLLTASSHFLGAPSCRRLPSRYESKALGIAREVCKCLRDERFAPDWNGGTLPQNGRLAQLATSDHDRIVDGHRLETRHTGFPSLPAANIPLTCGRKKFSAPGSILAGAWRCRM